MDLVESSLSEFRVVLERQESSPSNESAVVQLPAESIRKESDGTVLIEFERPSANGFIDLTVNDPRTVIEVKFHRTLPSGSSRPLTAQFGDILNDVRKLSVTTATRRILVPITDEPGLTHLRNKALIPVSTPSLVSITERKVTALATTAQHHAAPQGETWIDVGLRRIWFERLSIGLGIAWEISLVTDQWSQRNLRRIANEPSLRQSRASESADQALMTCQFVCFR
jgi:hypothetical protein